jgi:hypothetical protein
LIFYIANDPEKYGCESKTEESICQTCLHMANIKVVLQNILKIFFWKINAALLGSFYLAFIK